MACHWSWHRQWYGLLEGEELEVQLVTTVSGSTGRLRDDAFAVHSVEPPVLQVARLIVTVRSVSPSLKDQVDSDPEVDSRRLMERVHRDIAPIIRCIERMTVAMELAAATHHSSATGGWPGATHNALRGRAS